MNSFATWFSAFWIACLAFFWGLEAWLNPSDALLVWLFAFALLGSVFVALHLDTIHHRWMEWRFKCDMRRRRRSA